ncbi:hypothetical protein O181_011428 [Austropuccinia psidii MF-1]|uniref:CCHC-type domain-containing protein n=1 Tax=Austropuccinia psidii MF-1 TaxID=1389203 RepID=A0A9Q3GL98_9BASI|nr:hypothetical protein [Austropuccinia psidii MF-1]
MKPQPQGNALDDPYKQEDTKPDSSLGNKARSPSQYQDRDNISHLEKEALKQLPEASSWPKLSGTGEHDHMERIDYIDGLSIDLQSIQDFCINGELYTEFKAYASIWYTEMKEVHGRRNWPWWKSNIIQKYCNDPYEWCLRQSKRLKAIDPEISIQMRSHKLLKQIPGELAHSVKCRCNQSCTLDDISNTLEDYFERDTTIESGLQRQTQRKKAEVTKKRNNCHNCGSTDHYANNCLNVKKKVYAIEHVPEEESPQQDSESDSMGDAIREQSDDDQDPREELLVENQQETQIEIQDIELEAGMPQGTSKKNLCKHTQDEQTFLVTPTKEMAYIHATVIKITVCIENDQHPLIIVSGAHCSIVARTYLDHHFPNWDKQLLPAKEKNLKPTLGKMTSIGTSIKELIILHRIGNIRLNSEFFVLKDAQIQGFLLMKDYQRMYGMDIHNSKNRHITIGTNKEKEFSLDIYQISTHDPLPSFAIGEEPLGKIRGHDVELYLDVGRPYLLMLRRPPYPESPETRKDIEKHIN